MELVGWRMTLVGWRMAFSGYSQEQGGGGFFQAGLELAMSCQGVPRPVPIVPCSRVPTHYAAESLSWYSAARSKHA